MIESRFAGPQPGAAAPVALGLCAMGCAFFAPIGIAGFNVFAALAVLAWVVWIVRAPARLGWLLRQPVVQGGLALFGLYALSLAWTSAPRQQALAQLASYRVLWLPLFFVPALIDPLWRGRTLAALLASLTLVLILSWVQWVHPLPFARATQVEGGRIFSDAYVFSDRIRQSIHLSVLALWAAGVSLMVFGRATALASDEAVPPRRAPSRRWVWGHGLLLALCLVNMLWLVKGRTAWIVVSALAVYGLGVRFGRRGWLWAGVWCALIVAAVTMGSGWVGERLAATLADVQAYQSSGAINPTGERLEMWHNALAMLQQAPWLGHGIESYPGLSAQYLAAQGRLTGFLHHDPHQEWLYVGVELGLLGMALLAVGLLGLWRLAGRFDAQWCWLTRGFVVIYLAAGSVNGVLNLGWMGYFFGLLLALVAGRHAQARGRSAPGGPAVAPGLAAVGAV